MIPVSGNKSMAVPVTSASARSSILRKRDADGVTSMTAIPTTTGAGSALTAMVVGSAAVSSAAATAPAVTLAAATLSSVRGVKNLVPILHAMGNNPGATASMSVQPTSKMELIAKDRTMVVVSPPAGSPSDGSTTVSAVSSPGAESHEDEEEEEEEDDDEELLSSVSLSMKMQAELQKKNDIKMAGQKRRLHAAASEKEARAASADKSSRDVSPRKKPRKNQK